MKRRSFILGLAAGAVMPTILPAGDLASAQTVWNAQRLTDEIERMFRCRDGEPRAFMDITKGHDGVRWVELNQEFGGEDADIYRVTYATFAFGIEGGSPEAAEAQLAEHFYNEFRAYEKENALLYWRLKPAFVSDTVLRWGDTWATKEEVEDGFKSLEAKPADVELDFVSGNYRYVTERVQLHTMRMRLAIPKCAREELKRLAKVDGAPVARI